jgi:hypothetical protein
MKAFSIAFVSLIFLMCVVGFIGNKSKPSGGYLPIVSVPPPNSTVNVEDGYICLEADLFSPYPNMDFNLLISPVQYKASGLTASFVAGETPTLEVISANRVQFKIAWTYGLGTFDIRIPVKELDFRVFPTGEQVEVIEWTNITVRTGDRG